MARTSNAPAKRVNLALQGGGSHGAFTWGVLDRLLAEPGLEIASICGTSAGAMNAAALVSGQARDGREAARADLARLWQRIGQAGAFSPLRATPFDRMLDNWRLDNSLPFMTFDMLTRLLSPYQINPLNLNPLREILVEVVDFDLVRLASGIDLFVCATHVESGKVRVFRNREIGVESLLASACLPYLFQAVEIDGEHYWDGGYMGNPALWPLIYESDSHDMIIVQINPLSRAGVPTSAHEIRDRLDEISFNSTLMREMRAIHFVNRLIDGGKLDPSEYRRTNIHLIEGGEPLKALHATSKLNAEPDFIDYLFRLGVEAAETWIATALPLVGVRSSVDVAKVFL